KATVRERTQAVEKLSASEAETGRLHLELAAARTAAADKQASTLRAAEAELGELKASLAVARQGLERERQRVDQETRRAESLCKELQASETRRKAQEDDISLARNQVAKLAAQIEKEKNETRTEIVAAARQDIAAATEREGTLRATLDKAESDLQASRQREREALDKVVDLKTELAVGRNGLEQTETALAGALERARQLAEVAEAARQDKETLKRELVAAQTHAAGVRAENGRLAAELERVSATRSNSAAAAVAAAGGGGGSGDAAEAAAKSAVATALEMRTELENRLVLAQAEATEARTEVQRLKSDLNTETAARRRREVSGGAAMTGDEGDGPGGNSGWASQALREACAMMDRVSSALVDAVDDPGFGSPGGRGENALDDPRWAPPMLAPAQERNRGRIAASKRDRTVRIHRRRRALSVDSLGEGGGEAWFSLGKNATDVEAWRDGESSSRDMGRVCSERLRFSAARLLAVRREECLAADGRLARLREDLRDSEAREAETAARLEESRELSREQTGFVEGVWQERRRLEGELGARREEVERLRASEDAARMAATVLESRVEELSAALRKGLAAAASPAAAAAGNEAREAVEAIRRQLDDLRREGEFQRLRAKYEKAKGRIASLEEQVAATRRAGGLARKEFQGALEALKLSQALLLRIQRDRGLDGGGGLSREAQPLSTESHRTTATTVAESASAFPIAATMSAPPVQAKTDLPSSTQVHELTVQASRLRDMSRSVKSLLQLATGEVEGALEATSNSAGSRREKATATTQTENGVWWGGREVLDKLKEELGMAKTTTEILQQENARLEQELDRATAQLGEVGEMLDSKTAQVVELEAQVNRAESDQRAANESVQSANNRVVEAENSQKALRESLESKDRELLNTTRRLDAAVGAEAELRGRCEELALASGAFAAEVARQKEESAKWQKHSRLAAENVSELRKRCAELVRMSDTCAKQRAQLEKELTSARAESQEVDADVAQVLDALASSEKERRRLEGKLEKQAKVAGDARRAARLAEGKSADVQRDSLDSEIKRRMELERESKALASRVTDLEAALISASAEVRNGAKLAAERGAKHEKEVGKLNAEASRLRKELGVQSAKAREVEEREAEGRRKWAEEKAGIKEDAASAIERASHAAEAEVAKHEARRRQLLDNHERESDEAIRLRKEVEKITEALANETSLRARAVQDAAALRQNVEDLESALHKA
ncbi:unnamed protein product, partial [Sphacelaria rigidula]